MAQQQVYVGTLEEIVNRYGKELNGRRLKVIVDESMGQPKEVAPAFYETASPAEWTRALREWAAAHPSDTPPLSDAATDRESIYEGRGE